MPLSREKRNKMYLNVGKDMTLNMDNIIQSAFRSINNSDDLDINEFMPFLQNVISTQIVWLLKGLKSKDMVDDLFDNLKKDTKGLFDVYKEYEKQIGEY